MILICEIFENMQIEMMIVHIWTIMDSSIAVTVILILGGIGICLWNQLHHLILCCFYNKMLKIGFFND